MWDHDRSGLHWPGSTIADHRSGTLYYYRFNIIQNLKTYNILQYLFQWSTSKMQECTRQVQESRHLLQ